MKDISKHPHLLTRLTTYDFNPTSLSTRQLFLSISNLSLSLSLSVRLVSAHSRPSATTVLTHRTTVARYIWGTSNRFPTFESTSVLRIGGCVIMEPSLELSISFLVFLYHLKLNIRHALFFFTKLNPLVFCFK